MKAGLGRAVRITRAKDFETVVTTGRKYSGPELIVWIKPSQEPLSEARLGVSVSRKVGEAVARNRFKRLLREAFRLNRVRLKSGLEIVAYPRPGCRWRGLKEAESAFLQLCRKAGIVKE